MRCKIVQEDKWWEKQLEKPALLIAATHAQVNDTLGGDAPIGNGGHARSPLGLDTQHVQMGQGYTGHAGVGNRGTGGQGGGQERVVRPKPRAQPKPRSHNVVDGAHTMSRTGVPLCEWFNSAEGCSPAVSGQWCPQQYSLHLCNRCLSGTHAVGQCGLTEPTGPPRGPTPRGQGKGKGKGKKGKGKGAARNGKGGRTPY